MSIQFEQVEGVVQRDGDGPEQPQGAGGQSAAQGAHRTPTEQFESHHRRMEWMTRRLMAD